jgi:hypothetical protein
VYEFPFSKVRVCTPFSRGEMLTRLWPHLKKKLDLVAPPPPLFALPSRNGTEEWREGGGRREEEEKRNSSGAYLDGVRV